MRSQLVTGAIVAVTLVGGYAVYGTVQDRAVPLEVVVAGSSDAAGIDEPAEVPVVVAPAVDELALTPDVWVAPAAAADAAQDEPTAADVTQDEPAEATPSSPTAAPTAADEGEADEPAPPPAPPAAPAHGKELEVEKNPPAPTGDAVERGLEPERPAVAEPPVEGDPEPDPDPAR